MGSGRATMVAAILAVAGLVGCQDGGPGRGGSGSGGGVTVRAMNVPDDPSIAVLMYLPQTVTVNVGTSVSWALSGPEPHTVTFFPAGQPVPPVSRDRSLLTPSAAGDDVLDPRRLVNSGVMGPGSEPFRLRFGEPGTYTYHCVLHPGMIGTVRVVPVGAGADAPDDVTGRGNRELRQWAAEGGEAKRRLTGGPPVGTPAADGSMAWTVEMGASTAHTQVLAFSPVTADIRPGDRITFVNDSHTRHTATFPAGLPPPEDPSSPDAAVPRPGPSPQPLTAGEPAGTGTVPPDAPAPSARLPAEARSYTFVVAASGEYPYVCVYHQASAMVGLIRVA